jgi:hypothetical protein
MTLLLCSIPPAVNILLLIVYQSIQTLPMYIISSDICFLATKLCVQSMHPVLLYLPYPQIIMPDNIIHRWITVTQNGFWCRKNTGIRKKKYLLSSPTTCCLSHPVQPRGKSRCGVWNQ